jgi:hypothetical protein
MKKLFPLEVPNLKAARVLDSIKNDVRKYVKRERKKKLPEDVDFWDFDCKVGKDAETAEVTHVSEMGAAIDKALVDNTTAIYIEILSKPGIRTSKKKSEDGEQNLSVDD